MDGLRIRILKSLLHKPITYFDSEDTPPAFCVASMLQNAPDAMAALDYRIVINLSNLLACAIGVIIAITFSWWMGLLGAALSCSLLLLTLLNIRVVYRCHEKKEKEDHSSESAIEIIEQARSIKLAVVEKYFLRKYAQQCRASTRYNFWIGLTEAVNFATTQSFVFFSDYGLLPAGNVLRYVLSTKPASCAPHIESQQTCHPVPSAHLQQRELAQDAGGGNVLVATLVPPTGMV
ncbi:hypothetical protein COOONC_23796 [Cooperia oncophora]